MSSIRRKITVVLFATLAMLAATVYLVERFVVVPSFERLEDAEAEKDLDRCLEALQSETQHLAVLCHDWAAWDDAYQYVEDRNPEFQKQNMSPNTIANARLCVLCFLNRQGKLVWHARFDLPGADPGQLPDLFPDLLQADNRLVARKKPRDGVSGLLIAATGPILISSEPIVTTKEEGPVRGALLMGRSLDEEAIRTIQDRTHVPLRIWPVGDGSAPAAERDKLARLQAADSRLIEDGPGNVMYAYTVLRDIYDRPALLVRAQLDKSISREGRMAARIAAASSIGGGALILLVLWMALHAIVTRPLTAVTRHMVRVGQEDDLEARLNLRGRDEIGTLSREFDRMVERLADSRRQLLENAHRAGMADIAAHVLHNVGNVVNTLGVSAGFLDERLRESKLAGLEKAVGLLREHHDHLAEFLASDPRGVKLADYLMKLAEALTGEQRELLDEVQRLQCRVQDIREIISAQQSYASGPAFRQEYDLAELADDALRMLAPAIQAANVEVRREYDRIDPVPVNKTKLMQVLVNLVKNAVESMRAQGKGGGRLTLRVGRDGDGYASIEVSDSGAGIAKEDLARLFQQGFTTKPDGHGFGLHFSANALNEMGGTISVRSEGPGQGATFVLRLPLVCLEEVS